MTKSDHSQRVDVSEKGYVYIIGAGPGDPELLTIKAERALQEADVLLYDDLVSGELVDQFQGIKIYTGKRKDSHHFEQDEINSEIVRHALMGKKVARLKGGDPFVFGRGGEEIEVLRKNGIRYEIIPGITAAYGASAYTEIPLTMRKISSSVAFCTGHPVNKIQVPDADTLVYYMVASTVHDVLDAVVSKGRSENTKVAIVQNATRYNQKIFTGTLGELRRREKAVYSPALLIIGDNINQFIEKNWFSGKRKVLLTGGDAKRYNAMEHIMVHFPCRQVDGADRERVKEYFDDFSPYSTLLFTSKFSVKYFFASLFEYGKDVRHLAAATICATGKAAALELQKHGVIPDLFFEPDGCADIVTMFRERGMTDEHILLPGSNLVDEYLVRELTTLRNRVTPLCVYMHEAQEHAESIDLAFIDEIYFASPSCVNNFRTLYSSIPENITVTAADTRTEKEYRSLFGES
ncbi:uroporphyrinogen-III C-methyltransferase [Chlorobium phaeobacteroides]|jgi:uroporphyrinogen III methyltransferase/synthase|uniref:uroporphyrinogen-III C-methyltransferase n=1 Tax=Chlorobium phaeobacteroides (strain DSM 266 / SMG 266 / 2430) TaxID=290317 RepID=A1BCT5_CHLPD|nr:uroporphyrinogen-III C-methyltransferase [Chlorobium phaeobacteroides]ABL64212.1 uroporphyrinogen-III C-methyltransferase [Chlorobium phaeobacteroides DSM 266]MBV5328770.1 uroporphyrinogen-III C-methyltransferase [Chlorobium sp.]